MYNGDILSELIKYTMIEYPDYDILKSKKKFRQRVYEQIIINEIIEFCLDKPFSNLIDVVEEFEIVFIFNASKTKSDIYKFQLNTIRKILIFLRKRSEYR